MNFPTHFKTYYLNILKEYKNFRGRSSRKEFWYFQLYNFLVIILLIVLEDLLGISSLDSDRSIFADAYNLIVLIPHIAVGVRRMHDVDMKGWFLLLPLINLILTISKGTEGNNRYGPKPIN